jgi:hypothetical protein
MYPQEWENLIQNPQEDKVYGQLKEDQIRVFNTNTKYLPWEYGEDS